MFHIPITNQRETTENKTNGRKENGISENLSKAWDGLTEGGGEGQVSSYIDSGVE